MPLKQKEHYLLRVGIQNYIDTLEMVWHVFIKLNMYLLYDPTSVRPNRILLTNF